jgi:hypothetical protein
MLLHPPLRLPAVTAAAPFVSKGAKSGVGFFFPFRFEGRENCADASPPLP